MKISDIEKGLAGIVLNDNMPVSEHRRLSTRKARLERELRIHDKFRAILKIKVSDLKEKLKKHECDIICLHGDFENVRIQHKGTWVEDGSGKTIDSESDDMGHMWCEKHGESSVVLASELCCETENIDEYKPYHKAFEDAGIV